MQAVSERDIREGRSGDGSSRAISRQLAASLLFGCGVITGAVDWRVGAALVAVMLAAAIIKATLMSIEHQRA